MHSLQIGQEYPAGAVSLGKDLAYLSKQTQWNTSVKCKHFYGMLIGP